MACPDERARTATDPPATPGRTPCERDHSRFSPYPSPARAIPRVSSSPSDPLRHSTPTSAGESAVVPVVTEGPLYQLVVRPIVKKTVGQRDTSGNTLDDAIMTGGFFRDIVQKLWDQFASRVKCRAVRVDGVWSTGDLNVEEWTQAMQFKVKKHVVDSAKSEHTWNQWLVKMRGHTVTLLIYEYGVAISRAQDLAAFNDACILPEQTDRAGATAEVSLREIVEGLQEQWGIKFRGEAVVWHMWGNHITRNLNRSTWEAALEQPPPNYVANLLRPADSTLERHLSDVMQSTSVALDCVRSSLADYKQLRRDWEAFGQRLEEQERRLEARMSVIEGFLRDVAPPSPRSVTDPLIELENVDDTDHID